MDYYQQQQQAYGVDSCVETGYYACDYTPVVDQSSYNQFKFETSTPTSYRTPQYCNSDYSSYYSYYQARPQQQQVSSPLTSTYNDYSNYYASSEQTFPSTDDSAYVSQQCSYNTPVQQKATKRKRNECNKNRSECCANDENLDPKCPQEIVEQIFTDAAVNCDDASKQRTKRSKIYKLDIGSSDCREKVCHICTLSFHSHAKLLMHQYKYHSNGSSTDCPICFKKFGNQANALVHLRAHTQEKTYKCTFCNNAFCDSSTLKKHLRTHTGEKPYECSVCLKKFTQSGNLKRHMLVHATKYPTRQIEAFQFQSNPDNGNNYY